MEMTPNPHDPRPSRAAAERAKRALERAGLGELADDGAEVTEILGVVGRHEWFTPGPGYETCQSCGRPDCTGRVAVEFCPSWTEAAERNARGEYLPVSPGHTFVWRGGPIGDVGDQADAPAAWPDAMDWHPALAALTSAAEAYAAAGPRYGADPWGRPWCACFTPRELHAHIPGSTTGAVVYAPRPGPPQRRSGGRATRFLRTLAYVMVLAAAGLVIIAMIKFISILLIK